MRNFFFISLAVHILLVSFLIYSDRIKLGFLKSKNKPLASSTIQIDLTYKPTDTAMRLGKEIRNLPPPDIAPPPPPAPEAPTLKEKTAKKEKEKKAKEDAKRKVSEKREIDKARQSMKNIFDKLKREASREDRPPPKIDNFPTNEKGEIGARGTGGRGQRILSPAEQALQAAMRRHFDLTDARTFRKANPNAEGYIEVALVGVGSQFQIRALRILDSTGFVALDQSCERAIRTAIDVESFSTDVVKELNGKESAILCRP